MLSSQDHKEFSEGAGKHSAPPFGEVGAWEFRFGSQTILTTPGFNRIMRLGVDRIHALEAAFAPLFETDRADVLDRILNLSDANPSFVTEVLSDFGGEYVYLRLTAVFDGLDPSDQRIIGTAELRRNAGLSPRLVTAIGKVASRTRNPFLTLNPQGFITWVNESLISRTGFFVADLIGQSVLTTLPSAENDVSVHERMQDALAKSLPLNLELLVERKSNRPYWAEMNLNVLFDEAEQRIGFVIMLVDMTDRRANQAKLTEQKLRLEATLNAIPDILIEQDSEGRFIHFPTTEHVLAYDHVGQAQGELRSAIGFFPEEVVGPEEARLRREAMAEIDKTGRTGPRVISAKLGDQTSWFELLGSRGPTDPRTERHGYIFLARNIDSRIKAETESRKHEELLNSLFELSPLGICLNEFYTGQFIEANRALCELLGYSADELMAMSGLDLGLGGNGLLSPDHIQALRSNHRIDLIDLDLRHKNGHMIRISASMVLVKVADGRTLVWTQLQDITEKSLQSAALVAANEAVLKAQNQLVTAINAMADGFAWFDKDDRLVLANDAYFAVYGPDNRPALEGMTFEEIVRLNVTLGIYAEPVEDVEAFVEKRVTRHRTFDRNFGLSLVSGRTERVIERPTPDGGRVGIYADVSELFSALHRAEAAEALAKQAEDRLLEAVESIDDGFVLFDANDRLVLANSKYKALVREAFDTLPIGVSFEELYRKVLSKEVFGVSPEEAEAYVERRMQLHRAEHSTHEQNLANGRVLKVVESRTKDGGFVGLRVDVTELYEARMKAEASNRVKSLFLANIGHEIRTPLTGILGISDLLLERLAPGENHDLAAKISSSGEALLTILNDLLDMSKIEAGKLELEEEEVSPREVAERTTQLYRLRAAEKRLNFELVCADDANGLRRGDAHRVAQILHNLLSNAMKFTQQGSVTLSVDARPGRDLILTVKDTGIGMNAEQTARMFREFEQADLATTRRFGGTGLGMSIVRNLTRLMGGTITVDSSPGMGTSVVVSLPLAEVAPKAAVQNGGANPSLAPTGAARHEPTLVGLRALVADDNAINREILAAFFAAAKIEVTLAEDGLQAVAACAEQEFDILLLDISMPNMDGINALHEIRAYRAAKGVPQIPAIAITANAMVHQLNEFLEQGFDSHMTKPFRRDALFSEIARLTGKAQKP